MIKIIQNQPNLIIVAHEIYGINEHIKSFCEQVAQAGFDVVCPNLLKEPLAFSYSEEKEAYHHFHTNCSFLDSRASLCKLASENRREYKQLFIVGFSVGATAAWLASSSTADIDGAVCLYGSRIRDYTELVPKCPVLLVFPEEEQSFDVTSLMDILVKKEVKQVKLAGKHGFCDPFSKSFNIDSAKTAWSHMLAFFRSN